MICHEFSRSLRVPREFYATGRRLPSEFGPIRFRSGRRRHPSIVKGESSMKKHLALSLISAVVLSGSGLAAHADFFKDTDLRAQLRGLHESPPTNSKATGDLKAEINADETAITFTLTFSNLTANAAVAHIHFGPTKVNGGVMVFFCGGGGKPACPAATSGTVTGTITAADIVGPAPQGIPAAPAGAFADVVRAIKTGNGYANVHTATFPGGEIRGQVFVLGFGGFDD